MGYLDGSLTVPVAQVSTGTNLVPNLAYKTWHTQDRILLRLLYASLTEECMAEVVNCTTAHDAWFALEVSFSHSSKTRELQLKDELQLMQHSSRGVAEYARSFRSLCDQLSVIGKPVDDTDKVHWFLRGLGSDFKIFSTSILSQLSLPSFANLVLKALSHELFSRPILGDSSSQSAMVVHHGSFFGCFKPACPLPASSQSTKTSATTCQ